jgi:hypothetical protein
VSANSDTTASEMSTPLAVRLFEQRLREIIAGGARPRALGLR